MTFKQFLNDLNLSLEQKQFCFDNDLNLVFEGAYTPEEEWGNIVISARKLFAADQWEAIENALLAAI